MGDHSNIGFQDVHSHPLKMRAFGLLITAAMTQARPFSKCFPFCNKPAFAPGPNGVPFLLFHWFLVLMQVVQVSLKFHRVAMEVPVIRPIKEMLLLVRHALGLAAINKIMELFKQIRQLLEEPAIRSIMEM